jgi:CheY-like chemotaxis protein
MLPAAPGSGAGPAAAHRGAVMEHAGAVLVVDDEGAIRDVAHRVLTSAGYRVMTAANGQEALDILENLGTPADVLLTDVVMPGMTGKDFAARVKKLRPAIRVLFMSGYERPGDGADDWPEPETAVIDKPFSRAALLARVTQVLTEDMCGDRVGQPEQQLVRVRRR